MRPNELFAKRWRVIKSERFDEQNGWHHSVYVDEKVIPNYQLEVEIVARNSLTIGNITVATGNLLEFIKGRYYPSPFIAVYDPEHDIATTFQDVYLPNIYNNTTAPGEYDWYKIEPSSTSKMLYLTRLDDVNDRPFRFRYLLEEI